MKIKLTYARGSSEYPWYCYATSETGVSECGVSQTWEKAREQAVERIKRLLSEPPIPDSETIDL